MEAYIAIVNEDLGTQLCQHTSGKSNQCFSLEFWTSFLTFSWSMKGSESRCLVLSFAEYLLFFPDDLQEG